MVCLHLDTRVHTFIIGDVPLSSWSVGHIDTYSSIMDAACILVTLVTKYIEMDKDIEQEWTCIWLQNVTYLLKWYLCICCRGSWKSCFRLWKDIGKTEFVFLNTFLWLQTIFRTYTIITSYLLIDSCFSFSSCTLRKPVKRPEWSWMPKLHSRNTQESRPHL